MAKKTTTEKTSAAKTEPVADDAPVYRDPLVILEGEVGSHVRAQGATGEVGPSTEGV